MTTPVVDITPLQTGHRYRGIGGYVRGLVEGLHAESVPHETYGFNRPGGHGIRRPTRTVPPVPDVALMQWMEFFLLGDRPLLPTDMLHLTSYSASGIRIASPYVVTVYDLIPTRWPDFYLRFPHQRFLYKRYLETVRRASAVLAISECVADECADKLRRPQGSIMVTPLAPRQLPDPRPRHPLDDRPFIYVVGEAEPHKNLPFAHEVARLAYAAGYELAVVHTGAFPQRLDDLFHRSRRANLEPLHLGYVDDQVLSDLYHHAVVCLMPSLYEGFGLPALEALQAGGRVIVSDRGALPETIGDAAPVLPLDPSLWADAVVAFAEGSATWDEVRAKNHARSYSWSRTARLTADVYGELGV